MYYSDIHKEGLRNTTEGLCSERRCPDGDAVYVPNT
jgi:hypothetical protein